MVYQLGPKCASNYQDWMLIEAGEVVECCGTCDNSSELAYYSDGDDPDTEGSVRSDEWVWCDHHGACIEINHAKCKHYKG